MLKKHFLLSKLKTVVLFHIFEETALLFFRIFDESIIYLKWKSSVTLYFTVTSDQLNGVLDDKVFISLQYILLKGSAVAKLCI